MPSTVLLFEFLQAGSCKQKIRVVCDIEALRSNFKSAFFWHYDVLHQRDVPLPQSGPADSVLSNIAERAFRPLGERIRNGKGSRNVRLSRCRSARRLRTKPIRDVPEACQSRTVRNKQQHDKPPVRIRA